MAPTRQAACQKQESICCRCSKANLKTLELDCQAGKPFLKDNTIWPQKLRICPLNSRILMGIHPLNHAILPQSVPLCSHKRKRLWNRCTRKHYPDVLWESTGFEVVNICKCRDPSDNSDSSVNLTGNRIHREVLEIIYKINIFGTHCIITLLKFVRVRTQRQRNLLSKLQLTINFIDKEEIIVSWLINDVELSKRLIKTERKEKKKALPYLTKLEIAGLYKDEVPLVLNKDWLDRLKQGIQERNR